MSADDEQDREGSVHAHAVGIGIPAGVLHAMSREHDTAHSRAEEREKSALRWLDGLDVEGLMALRWVLVTNPREAYANVRYYDGMVVQLLRSKGVDPDTGVDPTVQLLESAGAEMGPAL